jgi:hypothetical protein
LPSIIVILILATTPVAGTRLVASDDFVGEDRDPLDDTTWRVYHRETNDVLRIELDKVRVEFIDGGWSFARTREEYESKQLTFLIDWNPHVMRERPVDIRFINNNSGTVRSWCNLRYQLGYGGWINDRHTGGSMQHYSSGDYNVQIDTWYQLNMTIDVDRVNLTVRNKENGAVLYSLVNASIDEPQGTLMAQFGMLIEGSGSGQVWYDNFRLYDNSIHPNVPPSLEDVPVLNATEDVPYTFDFSPYVRDPDSPLRDITIASDSPYVQSINGFEVTFLFPEGVLSASVPLLLSDGLNETVVPVDFDITPVNDAPYQDVETHHTATEDVPYTIDFGPHVWDVDDDRDALRLEVDPTYMDVDGLNLTATFPEGILTYTVQVNVSDGELFTPVTLRFTVVPVDDPPVIEPLGRINVTEDVEEVFDVAPFLTDVDTPVGDLLLMVYNRNCTVEGQTLRLLYTLGDVDDVITVKVSDGGSIVTGDLLVHVVEVNDPPVFGTLPTMTVVEGFPEAIDLSAFVTDEDTPIEQLALSVSHPAILDVSGLVVTIQVDDWVAAFGIDLSVSDGSLTDEASMQVQVTAVNDDPVIVSVGGETDVFAFELDEDTTRWLQVVVEDEDSEVFEYSIEADWGGITAFANGTLRLVSEWNVITTFTAVLHVDDDAGGSDEATLSVTVLNVNDPPEVPMITVPGNHSVYRTGDSIVFAASVSDPDMEHGQVLTVTWTSDGSGELMELNSGEVLQFTKDDLPVGKHRITVTVDDGEYTTSSWIRVTVEEEPVVWSPVSLLTLVIIIILVAVIAALLVSRMRRVDDDAVVETGEG